MSRRGVTLIEMMVVVVIIGIIATVVAVVVSNQRDRAAQELSRVAVAAASAAIERFHSEHGRPPRSPEELVFRPDDIDAARWTPILPRVPVDGWKRPLVYRRPGSDGFPFDVVSLGADGREGGEGLDEDLWNHARR